MSCAARLGLLWFFCLGGLGIHFPFFSLYLGENAGLRGAQVGLVLATLPLVGLAVQPLWGQLADRTGSRPRLLAVLAAGAAAGHAGLGFAAGFPALLLATAALACFSSALVPACMAVTLALTREAGPHAFGRARVWGTVGFFLLVVSFPRLLHLVQGARGLESGPGGGPSEPGLGLMFPITAAWTLAGAFVALALPREGAVSARAARGEWRALLRHGPFLRVLLVAFLAYFFTQGPMTMFSLFVRARGGGLEAVSEMWVLMLLLEFPLLFYSGGVLLRVGPRGLLALGILSCGLRWAVCGASGELGLVYAVSLLHGVVVAGLVVGAPLCVDAVVPERLRSTAQGLLAMVGLGLGGILSNAATGWLFERAGAPVPYLAGGLGALALGCLVPLLIPAAPAPRAPGSGGSR
jgi:PPP family 3-phenylpropionic acid transporter